MLVQSREKKGILSKNSYSVSMLLVYCFKSFPPSHSRASGTGCTLSMGEMKLSQRLPWESSSCGSAGKLVGYTCKNY